MRPSQSIATNIFQPYNLKNYINYMLNIQFANILFWKYEAFAMHCNQSVPTSHSSWKRRNCRRRPNIICTKKAVRSIMICAICDVHQKLSPNMIYAPKLISEYNFCQTWYTKAPKTNIIYAMYKKMFPCMIYTKVFSSWTGCPTIDPQCNLEKVDLYLCANQGPRISRIAIEPDNGSCHPEYHLWKVRRPKCRPPWLADRILSGPPSSLSSKGLQTNPLLMFSVLFLTEFQVDLSPPKGCKQPPCCSCFCFSLESSCGPLFFQTNTPIEQHSEFDQHVWTPDQTQLSPQKEQVSTKKKPLERKGFRLHPCKSCFWREILNTNWCQGVPNCLQNAQEWQKILAWNFNHMKLAWWHKIIITMSLRQTLICIPAIFEIGTAGDLFFRSNVMEFIVCCLL